MIDFKNLDKKQLTLLIFESAMSLFYLIFGVWLFVTKFFENPYLNIGLSVLFVVYGIYRVYRSCKKLFVKE